jgi:hypothetical protein
MKYDDLPALVDTDGDRASNIDSDDDLPALAESDSDSDIDCEERRCKACSALFPSLAAVNVHYQGKCGGDGERRYRYWSRRPGLSYSEQKREELNALAPLSISAYPAISVFDMAVFEFNGSADFE